MSEQHISFCGCGLHADQHCCYMMDKDKLSMSMSNTSPSYSFYSVTDPKRQFRPSEPISRSDMLLLLDEFNFGASMLSFYPVPVQSRVTVLDDISVAEAFSSDDASLSLFNEADGILLESNLAHKFSSRRNILMDLDVWFFWDIINLKSGWFVLDIDEFNSMYNDQCCRYIALIRNPLVGRNELGNLYELYNPPRDFFCSIDAGYDVLRTVLQLIEEFASSFNWGESYMCNGILIKSNQKAFFKYQLQKAERMIRYLSPAADIVGTLAEMNAIVMGFTGRLTRDFDICSYEECKEILAEQLVFWINSLSREDKTRRIKLFCDVNNL